MSGSQEKPVHYSGVSFRSKSKAKLAVCFDAWGKDWQYEPDICHDWWVPDFFVQFQVSGLNVGTLIEYSPKIPTDDCVSRLAWHFGAVIDRGHEVCEFLKIDCLTCQLWCIDFCKSRANGLCFHSSNDIEVIDKELQRLDFSPANRFKFGRS